MTGMYKRIQVTENFPGCQQEDEGQGGMCSVCLHQRFCPHSPDPSLGVVHSAALLRAGAGGAGRGSAARVRGAAAGGPRVRGLRLHGPGRAANRTSQYSRPRIKT